LRTASTKQILLLRPRHVDPAAEVMSSNPNLSPPIHPKRD
jgi:hypothetical protein